jgi:hypothetical protein
MTSVAYSTASPCRPRRRHERACRTIGLGPIKPRGSSGFSSMRPACVPARCVGLDVSGEVSARGGWTGRWRPSLSSPGDRWPGQVEDVLRAASASEAVAPSVCRGRAARRRGRPARRAASGSRRAAGGCRQQRLVALARRALAGALVISNLVDALGRRSRSWSMRPRSSGWASSHGRETWPAARRLGRKPPGHRRPVRLAPGSRDRARRGGDARPPPPSYRRGFEPTYVAGFRAWL